MKSVTRNFLYSAGVLLLATAIAKFVSASGSARILQNPDPLFGIQFRSVFWLVGGIETIVALFCLFSQRSALQHCLVAWLATSFLVYRMGLSWIGYHKPCNCLGSLTDALHISPEKANMGMKLVLAYLLIGSYASLFWLWRNKRKSEPSSFANGMALASEK